MDSLEKEFVPMDLALKLKALGFKERVLTYYEDGKPKVYTAIEGWDFNNSFLNCVSRPTFSQAFRWFREKYEFYASVVYMNSKNAFYITVYGKEKIEFYFDTYEEAELDCLVKLIEIVESKTE